MLKTIDGFITITKTFMYKVIRAFQIFSVINIIVYLLHSYVSIRNQIRIFIEMLTNYNFVNNINKFYITIKVICKYEIYIFIIFLIVRVIYNLFKKYLYENKILLQRQIFYLENEETSSVYKNIYDYLKSKEKRAFLLTGDWGSGKTYTINNFFDKYYKYQSQKVYKISCFGLDGRDSIIKEMKNIFESEDDSFTKKAINIVNKVPIIGDFLAGILKSDYELKDIKKESIFIFDDFERITPLGDIENRINRRRTILSYNRFQRQAREMFNVRNLDNEKNTVEYIVLSKYNTVIGIINELVDRYNMKVIVLCNTNEISKTFVHEMFECKLDCKKFKINTNERIFIEIVERILSNNGYIEKVKNNILRKFFLEISSDINRLWVNTGIDNIRILSSIISAFIELCIYMNNEEFEKYKIDIFYSIFLYHILYYTDEIRLLENIKVGQNICCYYLKLKKRGNLNENSLIKSIEDSKEKANVRWIGIKIASYWSVGGNLNREDIEAISNIDKYENQIEMCIVNDEEILQQEKYRFDDLMYILCCDINKIEHIKEIVKNKIVDFEYVSFKNESNEVELKQKLNPMFFYIKIKDIENIIYKDQELLNLIFKKIYITYKYDKINESNIYADSTINLVRRYNTWLELNKNNI